jgi:small nuclear ribonucleoprotein (snRNP)-like protein
LGRGIHLFVHFGVFLGTFKDFDNNTNVVLARAIQAVGTEQ